MLIRTAHNIRLICCDPRFLPLTLTFLTSPVFPVATHGLYDSTLIIIASDNGANPMVSAAGSNWPLRGVKVSHPLPLACAYLNLSNTVVLNLTLKLIYRPIKGWLWEGGLRVNAVVRSHKIPIEVRGSTYDGLFHGMSQIL